MSRTALAGLLAAVASIGPVAWAAPASPPDAPPADPAERLVGSLPPPLAELAAEILARNPDLARARAAAAAAELRAPQVASLPDPMATLTAFLLTPETRVGPQRASLAITQRLPWFGELGLREREALARAAAARAEVAAMRLALVTETRRLSWELAFLAAQERAVEADRATVARYEELARARYAAGSGLEQAVVKLQAEIARDDQRLLEIAARRATLIAALDALRDGAGAPEPAAGAAPGEPAERNAPPVPDLTADEPPPVPPTDPATLGRLAGEHRPELARARALIAAADAAEEVARTEYKPDLTLGLAYTAVGRRDDAAGRAMPPEGNGDDVLGLTFGVNLPVWRERLAAGVEEAAARRTAAEEELRAVAAGIDRDLAELAGRLPLVRRQVELLEGLLSIQAEEALRSAETAYASGTLGALDLLDAERVLLDVRISAARTRADYRIALARLEGALGAPLGELANAGLPAETAPSGDLP